MPTVKAVRRFFGDEGLVRAGQTLDVTDRRARELGSLVTAVEGEAAPPPEPPAPPEPKAEPAADNKAEPLPENKAEPAPANKSRGRPRKLPVSED